MNRVSIYLIKKYQALSKTKGKCRLSPTCSNYALACYQQFNFFTATYLTAKRLLKCAKRGQANEYDPAPNNIKGDFKWLI